MRTKTAQRWVKILLWMGGLSMIAAIVPVFMPAAWIDQAHRMLGWGPFPQAPVAGYLARLASAAYVMFGVFQIAMAGNVVRYRPLIIVFSVSLAVATAAVGVMALLEGVPWWWPIGDMVTAVAFYTAVALLCWRVREPDVEG